MIISLDDNFLSIGISENTDITTVTKECISRKSRGKSFAAGQGNGRCGSETIVSNNRGRAKHKGGMIAESFDKVATIMARRARPCVNVAPRPRAIRW